MRIQPGSAMRLALGRRWSRPAGRIASSRPADPSDGAQAGAHLRPIRRLGRGYHAPAMHCTHGKGALPCAGRRSRARFSASPISESRKRHLSRLGTDYGSRSSFCLVSGCAPARVRGLRRGRLTRLEYGRAGPARLLPTTGWLCLWGPLRPRSLRPRWHASGTREGMAPTLGARIYHIPLLFSFCAHLGSLAQSCARLSD